MVQIKDNQKLNEEELKNVTGGLAKNTVSVELEDEEDTSSLTSSRKISKVNPRVRG